MDALHRHLSSSSNGDSRSQLLSQHSSSTLTQSFFQDPRLSSWWEGCGRFHVGGTSGQFPKGYITPNQLYLEHIVSTHVTAKAESPNLAMYVREEEMNLGNAQQSHLQCVSPLPGPPLPVLFA